MHGGLGGESQRPRRTVVRGFEGHQAPSSPSANEKLAQKRVRMCVRVTKQAGGRLEQGQVFHLPGYVRLHLWGVRGRYQRHRD